MRTINLLASQIATLAADIAARETMRDESYDLVIEAEAKGDAEATARHDAWLEIHESVLTSLRANRYLVELGYNEALAEQEAA